MALTYVMCLCNAIFNKKKKSKARHVLHGFPGTLGWLAYNKTSETVITACSDDVNYTEVQRWREGCSIHGDHGEKVLGCTLSPLSGDLVNR